MTIDRISLDEIPAAAEKLLTEAGRALSPHLMALVDHALLPKLKLFRHWPGGKPTVFNLMSHLSGADDSISSLLIPLPSESEERQAVVAYLLKQCNAQPMLSLLASRFPPEAVAEHLATLTQILLPPDSSPYLLRFADTRIVPALDRLLVQGQHDQLFGPFERWAYIDRDGQSTAIKCSRLTDLPPGGPLALSEAQLDGFLQASMPDNFIPILRESSDSFAGEPPSLQYRLACYWIDSAHKTAGGKAESAECLNYCLSCLQEDTAG